MSETRVIQDLAADSGLVRPDQVDQVMIQAHPRSVAYRPELECERYDLLLNGYIIATAKVVPDGSAIDVGAIMGVYARYRAGRAFRSVGLIGSQVEAGRVIFLEEQIPQASSLSELVEEGGLDRDSATEAVVAIADEIWEMGVPISRIELAEELERLRPAFGRLISDATVARVLFEACAENLLQKGGEPRRVLSTRDLIGRNVLRDSGGRTVLVDYDLARQTTLFALDLARNFLHDPNCTERLFNAAVLTGLDRTLLMIATIVAECELQKRVHSPEIHGRIESDYRERLERVLNPPAKGVDDAVTRVRAEDARLRAALSDAERARSEAEMRAASTAFELRSARQEIDRLSKQGEATAARLEAVSAELQGVLRRVEETERSHRSAGARHERDRAVLEARCNAAEQALATIHGSRSWRLLSQWRRLKYGVLLRPFRAAGPEASGAEAVMGGAAAARIESADPPEGRSTSGGTWPTLPGPTGRGLLRVLYVTNRLDAPYRYRCVHAVRQLRADGVEADLIHFGDARLYELLSYYSVVVLFRLPWSTRVEEAVAILRRSGATILFDIDDLIFDPDHLSGMPALRNATQAMRVTFENTARRLRKTLSVCDGFIGATPALARAAAALGVRSVVHPNLLDDQQMSWASRVRVCRGWLARRPIIGYMSGSATHNEDFAMIAPALAATLREHPEALLLIGGFLQLPPELSGLGERVVRLPFMDWRVQLWALGLTRVNLAPLAEVNAFSDSKSCLKFFEAAAVGVPTISTPTEPFREAITHGRNGWLAESGADWRSALTQALDEATARRVGEAAFQTALRSYSHAGNRGQLKALLTSFGVGCCVTTPIPAHLRPALTDPAATASAGARFVEWTRRMRAVVGLLRRAHNPRLLSRPELCAPPSHATRPLHIDPAPDEIPANALRQIIYGRARSADEWHGTGGIQRRAGADGQEWFEAAHADPALISKEMAVESPGGGYLLVSMAAETTVEETFAQFFWMSGGVQAFSEQASVRFNVITDGRMHQYLVPLDSAGLPPRGVNLHRFRFDPMAAAGRFQVGEVAFLTTNTETLDEERTALIPAVPVDIVVPIYNARKDVERCVASVLRHATGTWRLILVDDASTDAELVRYLQAVAGTDPRIVLIRKPQNSGFVGTANRGMTEAAGRDVLLLNSDTVVTAGFLDRIRICAYVNDQVGVVSPLTNNGTICSVPDFCRDNELPKLLSIDEYGEMVHRTSLHKRPELVTGHGFCMYVKAGVLKKVGLFDEVNFGRGFGEENDFCEKVKAAGYGIRLCDDVFVAHTGKASFADEGRQLERVNSKTMDRLHPNYFAEVAEFCRRNPARDIQENVRYQLARWEGRRFPAMLFLVHADPFSPNAGGTEHHVRDLIRHLALPRAVVAHPERDDIVATEILAGRVDEPRVHRFARAATCERHAVRDEATEAMLDRIVGLFDVGAAHVHHLINWPIGVWRVFDRRQIPYAYTAHDFYCVCPNAYLMDPRAMDDCACTQRDMGGRTACVSAHLEAACVPAPDDLPAALAAHTAEFAALLSHAQRIITPSDAAARWIRTHHAALDLKIDVIEHGYDASGDKPAEPSPRDGPLRVAFLGQIAYPTKGAANYLAVLRALRDEPIEWHVFGGVDVYGYRNQLTSIGLGERLHLHGPYERAEICRLLREQRIDAVVLLPQCRETFSFTLSEAWLAGVPAVVSDRGAPADRVRATGAGVVVRDVTETADVLRRWAANPAALQTVTQAARSLRHRTVAEAAELHRAVYGPLHEIVTRRREIAPDWPAAKELFAAYWRGREGDAPVAATPHALLGYQQAWWYPWYRRGRGLVPERLRLLARRAAMQRRMRTVRRYAPAAGAAGQQFSADLVPAQGTGRQSKYRSVGPDPYVVFPADGVPSGDVDALLLRMRVTGAKRGQAQVFWRHSAEEGFTEDKSVMIRLQPGEEWQEHVVDLAESRRLKQWRAGPVVHQVRLDPIDGEAELAIDGVELVQYKR